MKLILFFYSFFFRISIEFTEIFGKANLYKIPDNETSLNLHLSLI